ncbi:unnamed protein product [Aureobasidium mustum]|uniref:Uncharacterized protein n=1 Tax=Aureobasidium mustum TaxID=2773714 RepID=A0A9N8JYS3_9PEZI|nr:unnamed protein product [Aureobasidium mustum]
MISSLAKTRIDDLVTEVFDAAHERAQGFAAMMWQSLVEEDFGAGGLAMRTEIADDIRDRVAAEGESVLRNTRELKGYITEVLITKINEKVEEEFSVPLRAWASR